MFCLKLGYGGLKCSYFFPNNPFCAVCLASLVHVVGGLLVSGSHMLFCLGAYCFGCRLSLLYGLVCFLCFLASAPSAAAVAAPPASALLAPLVSSLALPASVATCPASVLVAGAILALALAAVAAPRAAPAQHAEPTIYAQVDCMQSTSPDYQAVETEIWQPIHQIGRAHV